MWPLDEALARTLRREARLGLDRSRADAAADPEDQDATAELEEARHAIREGFRAMMAAGRLAGVGQAGARAGELGAIPAEAWPRAAVDWERSALAYGAGADRRSMVAVRVRPWLHLPDAPARLAGLPLATAFRRFVLDDPEFVAALDHARACFPGDYACRCSEVLDGRLSATERLWPADLADCDLAVEWMDPQPDRAPASRRGSLDWLADESPEHRAAFRMVRAAEAVVRDRVDRFLAPLRTGDLVATGYLVGRPEPAAILSAIWCRPSTRIDFVEGELLRAAPGAPPEREWTGLVLSLPPGRNVAPDPPVAEPKAKGGRPAKHAWEDAFARLAEKLMVVGEPESGAALARLMAECFEDMRAAAPAEDEIGKWLRSKQPRLWSRVTGAGRR